MCKLVHGYQYNHVIINNEDILWSLGRETGSNCYYDRKRQLLAPLYHDHHDGTSVEAQLLHYTTPGASTTAMSDSNYRPGSYLL